MRRCETCGLEMPFDICFVCRFAEPRLDILHREVSGDFTHQKAAVKSPDKPATWGGHPDHAAASAAVTTQWAESYGFTAGIVAEPTPNLTIRGLLDQLAQFKAMLKASEERNSTLLQAMFGITKQEAESARAIAAEAMRFQLRMHEKSQVTAWDDADQAFIEQMAAGAQASALRKYRATTNEALEIVPMPVAKHAIDIQSFFTEARFTPIGRRMLITSVDGPSPMKDAANLHDLAIAVTDESDEPIIVEKK